MFFCLFVNALDAAAVSLSAAFGDTFGRPSLVFIPHAAALAVMVSTETTVTAMAAFLLAWGILNFLWLAMLRRPAVAGTLSLVMMAVLVLLSQLKYHVLMMTANFVDLMIVDTDTISFLFTIFPALRWIVALSADRADSARHARLASSIRSACAARLHLRWRSPASAAHGLEMRSDGAVRGLYGGNLVSVLCAFGRRRRIRH